MYIAKSLLLGLIDHFNICHGCVFFIILRKNTKIINQKFDLKSKV